MEDYALTKKRKGFNVPAVPLKLQGNALRKLFVDPIFLVAGRLRVFKDGNLVLEALADESLFILLTKRLVKTKQYTAQAIETFKNLVHMYGLPIHGLRIKEC